MQNELFVFPSVLIMLDDSSRTDVQTFGSRFSWPTSSDSLKMRLGRIILDRENVLFSLNKWSCMFFCDAIFDMYI